MVAQGPKMTLPTTPVSTVTTSEVKVASMLGVEEKSEENGVERDPVK